ncbi:cytochrome c biogenesis CcdA family protein [Oceanithermus sp.]|uniref:cytochrome c biogenesis CcdA family protein n=1 Tax=Oceanithermus sp. TaxID=2268145 RepID=UPI0025E18240|nr:cytochrome c biogenesis CcdA family protein [Oceanithermus sp.]
MELSIAAAFFAGMLSFLSPCVLPLVPTYLAYLGGDQGRPVKNAVFFILGFSLIFILLGLPFTVLGGLLSAYKPILGRIGGVLLILFGLYMLGLKIPFLAQMRGVSYSGDTTRPWGAFLMGMALATAWLPCIGPILGGILTLTALEGFGGLVYLVAYNLGLAVPFLLVALFADRVTAVIRRSGRVSLWVERIAGAILVAVGILMVTDTFQRLNNFFIRFTPEWLMERL